MQKLTYESAWDRTLAQKDRFEIERVFSEINHENKKGQHAVLLKTAFNHKKEFLVTVLLNNYSEKTFSLFGKKVVYKEKDQIVGKLDSAYTFEIPAGTSMPWTFIFPEESIKGEPSGYSGVLTIN